MNDPAPEHGEEAATSHEVAQDAPHGELQTGTIAEHGDGHGEASSFSPFDMTYASPHIFWLILSFGLLFLVLWKIILPRLASTIEERNDRVAADLDQAARMKSDAEIAEQAYETALADSKAKAHAIAAENRAKLDAEVSAEMDQAEARFAKKAAEAEVQIRAATDKALSHVEEVAISATGLIVAKLGGTTPTAAQIRKAVQSAST